MSFWCPYETYHRLCVILFWAWNACDVSDPGRFLWDFNYDRLYPAWILSFVVASTPNNKFIRRQCIRNLLFGVLVCGIVGFPYMNRAVYSDGYGMK